MFLGLSYKMKFSSELSFFSQVNLSPTFPYFPLHAQVNVPIAYARFIYLFSKGLFI